MQSKTELRAYVLIIFLVNEEYYFIRPIIKYSSVAVLMALLKGWRYTAFIGGFVGLLGLTLYPVAVSPMIDSSQYKQIQKEGRKNINIEQVQPGNMKVWSDPFDRKKPQSE